MRYINDIGFESFNLIVKCVNQKRQKDIINPAVEEKLTMDAEEEEEEVGSRSAIGIPSGCRCADSKSDVHCAQPGMAWCYVREDSGCPDAAAARTMRGLRTWSKAACDSQK